LHVKDLHFPSFLLVTLIQ